MTYSHVKDDKVLWKNDLKESYIAEVYFLGRITSSVGPEKDVGGKKVQHNSAEV